MVNTSFCALVISHKPCNWMFELLAMLATEVSTCCIFTCDPLISQPIFIRSSNGFHHYSWWCDGAIIISIE